MRTPARRFIIFGFLTILLQGCSNPQPPNPDQSSNSPAPPAATPALQDSEAPPSEASNTSDTSADSSQAHPSTREEYLAGIAIMLGVENPPTVELVREITPQEQAPIMKECLSEQGFTVQTHGTSWSAEYPQGQHDAYALASYTCNAQYPLLPVYYQRMNEDTLRSLYEWETTVIVPCLEARGHQVDVPSLERYIDNYVVRDRQWSPEPPDPACDHVPPVEVMMGGERES